jgi:hypothetical protein
MKMHEPTIDEMLEYLRRAGNEHYHAYENDILLAAIRAILELHRDPKMFFASEEGAMRIGLECIRAFVERVSTRFSKGDIACFSAMLDELAALESEVKNGQT